MLSITSSAGCKLFSQRYALQLLDAPWLVGLSELRIVAERWTKGLAPMRGVRKIALYCSRICPMQDCGFMGAVVAGDVGRA